MMLFPSECKRGGVVKGNKKVFLKSEKKKKGSCNALSRPKRGPFIGLDLDSCSPCLTEWTSRKEKPPWTS
jgi:hypothetical protein